MENSSSENRSAFARAIERREGAMREMLGMGPQPVGHVEGDRHREPQVAIWRVGGDTNRPRAGWDDAGTSGSRRRQAVPWLLALSSIVKRNRVLSLRLWSRTQAPLPAPIAGSDAQEASSPSSRRPGR